MFFSKWSDASIHDIMSRYKHYYANTTMIANSNDGKKDVFFYTVSITNITSEKLLTNVHVTSKNNTNQSNTDSNIIDDYNHARTILSINKIPRKRKKERK